MLKYVGVAAAAFATFLVVFLGVFVGTFPGEAVAEFVRWQVQEGSKGKYRLELASTSPALFGLSAEAPELYQVLGRREDLVLSVDEASLTSGPFQLLAMLVGQEGEVVATLKRGEGDIEVAVQLARAEGALVPRGARVSGALPLAVLPSFSGVSLVGSGEIVLEADLSWTDGPSKANGTIHLEGEDLVLEGLATEDGSLEALMGDFAGFPAPIRVLDLELEVEDGKATVKSGLLDCDLVKVDVNGDLTLNDDVTRSRVRLGLVATIGPALETWNGVGLLKSTQTAALWKDGTYHYTWSGMLNRLGAPRPERERTGRPAGPTATERPTSRPTLGTRAGGIDRSKGRGKVDPKTATDRARGVDVPIREDLPEVEPDVEEDEVEPEPEEVPEEIEVELPVPDEGEDLIPEE